MYKSKKQSTIGKAVLGATTFILAATALMMLMLFSPLASEQNKSDKVQLTDWTYDFCFSPNGDELKDVMTLNASFTGIHNKPVYIFLFIKKDDEILTFLAESTKFSSDGEAAVTLEWDGMDWFGEAVPEGDYQLQLYCLNFPSFFNSKGLKPKDAYEKMIKAMTDRKDDQVILSEYGQVAVDNTPPQLTIDSPPDNLETLDESLETTGRTETARDWEQMILTVNGEAVAVADGKFSSILPLVLGQNSFTYILEDCAGNRTSKEITVIRLEKFDPPVVTFTASPETIQPGESAELSWTTENADTVSIDNEIGTVELNGSVTVSPTETTSYIITAEGRGGTVTSSVTVEISIPEPMVTIDVSPASIKWGQTATLTWTSENVDTVTIEPGIGSVELNGSKDISPLQTTTYTITATGEGGEVTDEVTLDVVINQGDYTAIYGRVYEADSGSPLADADVSANGRSVVSDSDGYWQLTFPRGGIFKIKITKEGYTEVFRKITLGTGEEGIVDNAYLTAHDTKTTPIGPDGGTHANSDGSVEVVFPQGALDDVKDIRVTRYQSAKALPGDLNATDNLDYPIGFLFCASFGPDDTQFNKPVTIRVRNSWGFAAGTEIPYAYWNKDSHKWTPVNSMAKVDANGEWLEADVLHFSDYDINSPMAYDGGYPVFEAGAFPEDDECDIGSSVNVSIGSLRQRFSVPGVNIRGGNTGLSFVYNSKTAYPTEFIKVEHHMNYDLALPPEMTSVEAKNPYIANKGDMGSSGMAGIRSPFSVQFNPSPYGGGASSGQGALAIGGNNASGRGVKTGFQKVEFSFTNYYSGNYYTTSRWGGMPENDTGVQATEYVYFSEDEVKEVFLVNRTKSPFGRGWHLEGLKKLHFDGDRIVIIDGDGSYKEYEKGVNYADVDYGASVSASHNMMNPNSMLSPRVAQEGGHELYSRFYEISTAEGTDQTVIVDLGQVRTLHEIGLSFPKYWMAFNVWDYVDIDISIDKQQWADWHQEGEPTLKRPIGANVDPLDSKIKSPIMAQGSPRQVRYIRYRLGFPSSNSAHNGSAIYRVFAIGSESLYRNVDEEKWPQFKYDNASGEYILTQFSGGKEVFDSIGRMIKSIDRQGRTISYSYEGSSERLLRIQYPGNAYMDFTYNGNDFISSIKDSSGRETHITTGRGGDITGIVYPDNRSRTFDYDGRGLMTKDISGDAVKTYYWNSQWPVLAKVRLPNGGERVINAAVLKYMLNTLSTDDEDEIIDYPYMEKDDGIDSDVTFEDGAKKIFKSGRGWKARYKNGKFMDRQFFANKRKNRITKRVESGPDASNVTDIIYNSGLQVRAVNSYLKDAMWQRVNTQPNTPWTRTDTLTNTNTYSIQVFYNEQNQVSKVTGPDTNMFFTYDANKNLIQSRNGYLDKSTKYTYDSNNNVIRIEYPDGKSKQFFYDSNGLVSEVHNNDGSKTLITRNNRGEVETITDEEGRTVTIERDDMGRVIKEMSPGLNTVQYVWGGSGCSSCGSGGIEVKLTKVIDSGNNVWEFKYDIMGNATDMIYPDGSKIAQTFDIAGRTKTFTNKRGQQVRYTYDSDGRLSLATTPEGTVTYKYDGRDRIIEIQAPDYHYAYKYGIPGGYTGHAIVEEKNLATGLWSQHIYNRYGLPTDFNDSFQWHKTYSYNFTQYNGTPIGFSPSIVSYSKWHSSLQERTVYSYDSGFRLSKKRNDYLKTERQFGYDPNGNLYRMRHTNVYGYTGMPDTNLYLNRDKSGLITSITGDKEMGVTYNSELEITGVQHVLPRVFDESYSYDSRGNRLSSLTGSYSYDNLNRLISSSSHTYQYDADGNLTMEKNTLTGETKKFYYNSIGRMVRYEHYATPTSAADVVATYTYDLYGRRLQKTVNGVVTNFFWEGDNMAYELDANYQPIRRYMFGAGKDDVEGHIEFSELAGHVFDNSKAGWYTYLKDQVGTVYKVYSDYGKQVVDTRAYDTFGNIIQRTGASKGNLGFQGKYYDQESGLYYFYNRYYNSSTGRFINEDPIGLNGGLNMYAFVFNNPANLIDPFGLDALTGNSEVRKRMCCIIKAVGWLDFEDKGRIERSFMVLENDKVPGLYIFVMGSAKNQSGKTTSKYPKQGGGWHYKGMFHNHPPGESETSSGKDRKNNKQYKIPIYSISKRVIMRYDNGRDTPVMHTQELINWCRNNSGSWEGCCKWQK